MMMAPLPGSSTNPVGRCTENCPTHTTTNSIDHYHTANSTIHIRNLATAHKPAQVTFSQASGIHAPLAMLFSGGGRYWSGHWWT